MRTCPSLMATSLRTAGPFGVLARRLPPASLWEVARAPQTQAEAPSSASGRRTRKQATTPSLTDHRAGRRRHRRRLPRGRRFPQRSRPDARRRFPQARWRWCWRCWRWRRRSSSCGSANAHRRPSRSFGERRSRRRSDRRCCAPGAAPARPARTAAGRRLARSHGPTVCGDTPRTSRRSASAAPPSPLFRRTPKRRTRARSRRARVGETPRPSLRVCPGAARPPSPRSKAAAAVAPPLIPVASLRAAAKPHRSPPFSALSRTRWLHTTRNLTAMPTRSGEWPVRPPTRRAPRKISFRPPSLGLPHCRCRPPAASTSLP